MIDPALYAAFAGTAFLLAITPGPDILYVLAVSLAEGRRAGLLAAAGIAMGLSAHVAVAVFGLSQLLFHLPEVYLLVRYLGAAYLLYLAWRYLRPEADEAPHSLEAGGPGGGRSRAIVLRAATMCLLNPKLAIFFLAFLPQFANPANGSVSLQLLLLGITFGAIAVLTFAAGAWCVGPLGEALRRRPALWRWQRRAAGSVLGGLAIWLALPSEGAPR